ncbi:iron-binding CDGSH zinc finger protein [Rhodococcus sp. OK519]|uniref:CDGSH iron-sulfur domain-containing protein n=1 Tax=Rhodococcus sp. OK519 TaxID=2135729 RepID=UPI000D387877|nr:iron-binding CDGSH zinc finger protein [Rhodococcus sp. OK519]
MTDSAEPDVVVTVCSDGPLLVRGPVALFDDAGVPIANSRATIALCRCGRTSRPPFCDSSHKRKKVSRQ